MCPGSADFDRQSPMCVPDLSGTFKAHFNEECSFCYGSKHDGPDPYPPEEPCVHCEAAKTDFPKCCGGCDLCPTCDGEGKEWFWCWYKEDTGTCDTCMEENVPITLCDDNVAVCMVCYLKHHRTACGCDLWKEAESFILGE